MAKGKPYAAGTDVPVERSRAELEKLLSAHGATEFGVFTDREGSSTIIFRIHERMVRQRIVRPDLRTESKLMAEMRRRWRALILITKAKLEVIAAGDSTFEREFFVDVLLRDGRTVGEAVGGQLASHYEQGEPQPLLLSAGS
jgi:hypothetical protein